MTRYVDPPSGWRYGFPKPLPPEANGFETFDFRAWLVHEGYPEEEVDFAMQYCRQWESGE